MSESKLDFAVTRLGEARFSSPMKFVEFADERRRVLCSADLEEIKADLDQDCEPPAFELAGPRERIFFDPAQVKCGIVTCGGLCPGLNDVIRAIVLSLYFHYGVRTIYGFRYGYEGLISRYGHRPLALDPEVVDHIGDKGGTILGSSRGDQNAAEMVTNLKQMGVSILFTIGGDGTQRGANAIATEALRRGLDLAVVGIPKTIDNDISFVQNSFGFYTAAAEAGRVVTTAHNEAKGARNGVGLVKLMGRESGFIAAYSALASSEVNFCLVPEVPFTLEAFLTALKIRLEQRGHAVVVAAEGAGQELLPTATERDASGNRRPGDIGIFLRDRIKAHFKQMGMEMNLKYIDPSYTIRGIPANAYDSAFCLMLGQNAVHAGMAGCTNMIVGNWRDEYTHVPIPLATAQRKKINPRGWMWSNVLACTGQPRDMR